MKNYFLIVLLTAVSSSTLNAQDKMVIDQPYNGETVYQYSAHISSMSQVPSVIRFNVSKFLDKILGTMSAGLIFSHGQIVDLGRYFSEDSLTYGYGWIVPKYDLNFILRDTSIGIRSYYLQVRLDEYGQILKVNWPREFYADKTKFIGRTEMQQFVLRRAKLKNFESNNFQVDLKYNEKEQKLCWVFEFPIKTERKDQKKYNVLEIDWEALYNFDEYEKTLTSVE